MAGWWIRRGRQFVRRQGKPSVKTQNRADLIALMELVDAGKIRPVIDSTYALAETPKAIAQAAGGHVRGTIVVSVSQAADKSGLDSTIKKAPAELTARGWRCATVRL